MVSTPKPPAPPPPPPNAPTNADPSALDAARRVRAAAGRGFESTLLTGSGGVLTPPRTTGTKALFGE